jgi:phytoene dehydrogenase-like protein
VVVERADGPGGCAHAFRRGEYLFDPAIHLTVEAGEGHFLDTLLNQLNVRDRCTLVDTGHLYQAVFPDLRFDAPAGFDAFIDAHAAAFPAQEDGFRRFFAFRDEVIDQMTRLPLQLGLTDLPLAMKRFPLVFKHRSDSFDDVLVKFVDDPQARALTTAFWPYLGLPPSRLSFFFCAQLMTVFMPGAYYSVGSFQKLADAFVAAIEENGGEVLVNSEVEKIVVEKGRARGVVLAGGAQIDSNTVISNADITHTLQQLVGQDALPRSYWNKIKRLKPSLSGFVVFGASKRDLGRLGLAHENFVFKHWDHDATHRDILEGRTGGMWMNVPTLIDDTLAPAGEHLVIISALTPFESDPPWSQRRESFAEALVSDFDTAFPGLADGLEIVETATPESLHAATLAREGAVYGWENTPQQAYNKRPQHETPIEGLWVTGQWSQESGSSFRAMFSGVETARLLLEPSGEAEDTQRIIDSIGGTPAPVKFGH